MGISIYQSEGVPERRILIPGCVGIGGSAGGPCLSVCVSVCVSCPRVGRGPPTHPGDPPWRHTLATHPGDPPGDPPRDPPRDPSLTLIAIWRVLGIYILYINESAKRNG